MPSGGRHCKPACFSLSDFALHRMDIDGIPGGMGPTKPASDKRKRLETGAREIPSPLNGEKVAKGRMRGGNADYSGLYNGLFKDGLALSPLTPALPMNQSRHCVVMSQSKLMRRLLDAAARWGQRRPTMRSPISMR